MIFLQYCEYQRGGCIYMHRYHVFFTGRWKHTQLSTHNYLHISHKQFLYLFWFLSRRLSEGRLGPFTFSSASCHLKMSYSSAKWTIWVQLSQVELFVRLEGLASTSSNQVLQLVSKRLVLLSSKRKWCALPSFIAWFCSHMRQPQDKSLGLKMRGRRHSSLSSIAFGFLNTAHQKCVSVHRCWKPHVGHSDTWHILGLLLRRQMFGSLQSGTCVLTWPLLFAVYYHSSPFWHRLSSILMLFSEKTVKFFTHTLKKKKRFFISYNVFLLKFAFDKNIRQITSSCLWFSSKQQSKHMIGPHPHNKILLD